MKTRPKLSQEKYSHMKIYPHHPLHHIPSAQRQKTYFPAQKLLRGESWSSWGSSVIAGFSLWSLKKGLSVIQSFLGSPVIDFSLRSSMIGSFSGSSLTASSLGSSILFFRYAAIFYKETCLKTDLLLYIEFSKRRLHLTVNLTCFNNFGKFDSENVNK